MFKTRIAICYLIFGYAAIRLEVRHDVTELGIWDSTGGGLGTSHEVGIWNSSGTLLVSGLVNAGTLPGTAPSVSGGDYRLVDVSRTLTPGTYEIAAYYAAFGDFWAENATPLPISGVTYGVPESALSGSFARPTSNSFGITGSYFGPTFAIATGTPEPGSIALLAGTGITGLAALRRRRSNR